MLKKFHLIVGGDFNTTASSIDRQPQSTPTYRCISNSSLINLIHQLKNSHIKVLHLEHRSDLYKPKSPSKDFFHSHEPNIFSDHYNQLHLRIVLTDTHRGEDLGYSASLSCQTTHIQPNLNLYGRNGPHT